MAQDQVNPMAGGQSQATLKYGVYIQTGDFAGKTVAQARAEYARLWNIPPDATAFNGKTALSEDAQIPSGALIEWHRKMGEKGLTARLRRIFGR